MKQIYKIYRDRLVEITGKSRSLYSKNISKKQAYNLGKLFEGNISEAESFRDYLWKNNKRHYKILTDEQVLPYLKDLKLNNLSKAEVKKITDAEERNLTRLKREIEEIQKDTGRYELFVGYPFVEGMIGRNVMVKAPLLLFPARLHIEKEIELQLLKDEPVQLNKVFLLAYAREMHLNIDDFLTEFDELSDRFSSIDDVRDYLAEQGIKLKYTQKKKIFTNIELAKENNISEPEIKHYCVLGRFPLANSIYYDYNELYRKKLSSPALESLLNNKEVKVKEKKQTELFTINKLDYAQEQAIEKVERLGHMVIYGPPGTGKSQTIVNIIADNICKNKKVLVVSQKRAALDVVYSRMGLLNAKAMILPDPEKSKTEFFTKVRARYDQIMAYKPSFDRMAYEKCKADLRQETEELRMINDALFTVKPFGITLQQMYTMSSNIGKNTQDYEIYQEMQRSEIMAMNYAQLSDAYNSIMQRNKGKLFFDHITLSKNNPLIDFIRTDVDMNTINQTRTFITKLISKEHIPFNVAGYAYSRYLLVYNLENPETSNLKPLADMITKLENPDTYSKLKITYVPPFWIAYPFIKSDYAKKRREIEKKLNIAQDAVKHFVNEFELLKAVLEPAGLAMVIDSIAYGNDKFLRKLLVALDDYVSVRTMKLAHNSITDTEHVILNFVKDHTKSRNEFFAILKKVLSIRIYIEVIREERQHEQYLSKTIIYEDLRKRIIHLKSEQKKMADLLAQDNFNAECRTLFTQNPGRMKNFLHQINKLRQQWPVRRMMEVFGDYLLMMFPCWLLSPESVSSILPIKSDLFDIALFDEASQLFIESTIPAIYRAKSLVISGDSKQLRPTSVFVKRYMGDDSYDSDQDLNSQALMEVESLLDLASSRLKTTHLTYHYRSVHEELINFSNYAFYGGNLQVSPNVTKNKNYLPIERIKVDGRWLNRHNEKEGQEVLNIVKKIFRTRKENETIGIVTFNTEQEEYIKDLFDEECMRSEVFKRDYLREKDRKENGEDMSIFVKNLENVQGDERDIIIFSIAYARNEQEKLNTQFGTLSLAGGENRLNVAITRAKKKVYVITSVEPEEFVNVENTKNNGPKLLVKYLKYARAISQRKEEESKKILASLLVTPKIRSEDLGAFETILKDELQKQGYRIDINLGNADYKISLAVYDEEIDRYVLGLECDYAAYHSSSSMLERDVYRINFLESRGWKIMRIWSRDWWLNKQGLVKNIEREIAKNKKELLESGKAIRLSKRNGRTDDASSVKSKKVVAEEPVATTPKKAVKKVSTTTKTTKRAPKSSGLTGSKISDVLPSAAESALSVNRPNPVPSNRDMFPVKPPAYRK